MEADRAKTQTIGLTGAEVRERLRVHGPNVVGEAKATPAWAILVRQFTGLVVVLNGALGFVQEWR